MATLPVQLDEQALIRRKMSGLALPPGMSFDKVEPYEDWTGDDAWRIYLTVSRGIPLTESRLQEIASVHTLVHSVLRPLKLHQFPYVKLVEVD